MRELLTENSEPVFLSDNKHTSVAFGAKDSHIYSFMTLDSEGNI